MNKERFRNQSEEPGKACSELQDVAENLEMRAVPEDDGAEAEMNAVSQTSDTLERSGNTVPDKVQALAEGPAEAASDLAEAARETAAQPDKLRGFLNNVLLFVLVLVLGLLFTNFVLQRNTVQGSSMVPTLTNGDELFVEKVSRYFGDIRRGDIITIDTKGLDLSDPTRVIKRVIALPGETLEIREGRVFVNGAELEEAYLPDGTVNEVHNPQFAKVTLGENEFFCMGDNRMGSKDCRNFGPAPLKNVLGKVLVRFYPFDRMGRP